MDANDAFELTHAISSLANKIDVQNARQDETNDLLRSLIDRLSSNSQELLELREQLAAAKK